MSDVAERERVRLAYHEAGHAAAAYALGGHIEVASIHPTRRWSGVVQYHPPKPPRCDLERFSPNAPLCTWPASVRRYVETQVIVSLAGPEAELLRPDWQPQDGYVQPRHDERIAINALSSAELSMLAVGNELEPPAAADHAKVYSNIATLAAEPVLGGVLLGSLTAQTRQLVQSSRFARLVSALVPALLDRGDVGGADVHAILEHADRADRAEAHRLRVETLRTPAGRERYFRERDRKGDRDV